MPQQFRFERRIRAAKSEHYEARHYVGTASVSTRVRTHKDHNSALRHLSRAIVVEELGTYEYGVRNWVWPGPEINDGGFDIDDHPARRWRSS